MVNMWDIPNNTNVTYLDVEGNSVTGRLATNHSTYCEFFVEGDDNVMLLMHDVIDRVVKTNEVKMVTFDFIMDSFVGVDAPEGTDPDTLIDQAIELFRESLRNGNAVVIFDKVFDDNDDDEYGVSESGYVKPWRLK